MIAQKVPMVYDKQNECWRVEIWGQSFSLSCGAGLELHLGRKSLSGRLRVGSVLVSDYGRCCSRTY